MKLEELSEDLENVGDKFCRSVLMRSDVTISRLTSNILSEDDLSRAKERCFEIRQRRGCAFVDEAFRQLVRNALATTASLPYQSRNTLKAILVELWVTRIFADLAENVDQTSENTFVYRCETLSCRNDHSHRT